MLDEVSLDGADRLEVQEVAVVPQLDGGGGEGGGGDGGGWEGGGGQLSGVEVVERPNIVTRVTGKGNRRGRRR